MLTIAYLIVETWRALWKPRATVVRKSSFRTTLQQSERPIIPIRRAKEQASASPTAESTELLYQQRFSTSCEDLSPEPKSPNSPKSTRQQQPRSPQQDQANANNAASDTVVFGVGDNRKVIARGIPVPAKQVVPSVSKPIHSEIPAQTTSVNQATPPSSIPIPQQPQHHQQQQQQPQPQQPQQQTQQQPQQQQQQQQQQPSHIPTPVQKSVKTLVLEPSVSGNRMDETWAKKQLDKFSFGFDEADKDKSGSLSFDEVCTVLKSHGFNGSRTEAQFIFGQMDKDGNKSVSRDEFSAAMRKVPRAAIREYVYRKAFKQMDKDNSGFLTKTEIADATKNEGGIEIGSKVIGDLLCYISKDDDEKVNYEEFLRVFGIRSSGETMRKIFKSLDTDGSGFLTRNEMLDAVSNESELKLKASRIAQLLIDLVKDEDKKMSYEEFLQSWFKQ